MTVRHRLLIAVFALLSLFISVGAAGAQENASTCSAVVSQAMNSLATSCANLVRGTACLGHEPINKATFTEDVPAGYFSQPGDRADLAITEAIQTGGLNNAQNAWGVSVMNVNAGLPDDLATGVIFVQLGGVEVENGVEPGEDLSPMQRFYFRTGIEGDLCELAPSILFVQGPENVPVDLEVFGQPVRLHSTMVLRSLDPGADLGTELQLIVLSGLVILYPDSDAPILVPPGYMVTIQLGPEFVSLGIEGDADERGVVGRWSQPIPLTQQQLTELGIIEFLPENIINYPVDVPGIIIASALGGVFPMLDFPPNSPALAAAALACEFGQLPEEVCLYLGLE